MPPHENVTEVYDLLFYETEWYRDQISFHPLIQQVRPDPNFVFPKPCTLDPKPEGGKEGCREGAKQ